MSGTRTALHTAALYRHPAVVKLLFEHGADASAKNKYGETALHVAARTGHLGVMEVLLKNGADVNAKDKHGQTALHSASDMGIDMGHSEVVDVLLKQARIEVNAKDKDGWTPLHWGAALGLRRVVELLATHGADVTAEDNEGWTPIHLAAVPGLDVTGDPIEPHVGILNYLLRETGAIVRLAQNVVGAHERRQRVELGLASAAQNPGFLKDLADTLVAASSRDPGDAKLKSIMRQIAEAAGDSTGARGANRARKRARRGAA